MFIFLLYAYIKRKYQQLTYKKHKDKYKTRIRKMVEEEDPVVPKTYSENKKEILEK